MEETKIVKLNIPEGFWLANDKLCFQHRIKVRHGRSQMIAVIPVTFVFMGNVGYVTAIRAEIEPVTIPVLLRSDNDYPQVVEFIRLETERYLKKFIDSNTSLETFPFFGKEACVYDDSVGGFCYWDTESTFPIQAV